MEVFRIRLSSTQEVGDFVRLASEQSYPIQVADKNHRVNAKSFIGMFSLDCREPLTVTAHGEDCAAFLATAKRFSV